MDNHVHYIAVPEREDSLAKTVKEAHGDYSKYFNTKYGLVGHAWQNRFKSFPMDWDHCRNAIRYVELNPVRAGMVARAEDYRWSSAAAHCGLRGDPLLSGECPFVTEILDWSGWLGEKADDTTDLIRSHTRTGRPLGPKEFVLQLEKQTGRELLPQKRGRKPKSTGIKAGSR
jgi:putative transposase